jgi:hypothetical protein
MDGEGGVGTQGEDIRGLRGGQVVRVTDGGGTGGLEEQHERDGPDGGTRSDGGEEMEKEEGGGELKVDLDLEVDSTQHQSPNRRVSTDVFVAQGSPTRLHAYTPTRLHVASPT